MGSGNNAVDIIMRLLEMETKKMQEPKLYAFIEGKLISVIKSREEAGDSFHKIFEAVLKEMEWQRDLILGYCDVYARIGSRREDAETIADKLLIRNAGEQLKNLGIDRNSAVEQGYVRLGESKVGGTFGERLAQWVADSHMKFLQVVEEGLAFDNMVVEPIDIDLRNPEWYSNAFRAMIDARPPSLPPAVKDVLVGIYQGLMMEIPQLINSDSLKEVDRMISRMNIRGTMAAFERDIKDPNTSNEIAYTRMENNLGRGLLHVKPWFKEEAYKEQFENELRFLQSIIDEWIENSDFPFPLDDADDAGASAGADYARAFAEGYAEEMAKGELQQQSAIYPDEIPHTLLASALGGAMSDIGFTQSLVEEAGQYAQMLADASDRARELKSNLDMKTQHRDLIKGNMDFVDSLGSGAKMTDEQQKPAA